MRGTMAALGAAMACLLTVGCDGGGYDAGSTPKAPVVTQAPKQPAQNTESPPTQSGMTAGMQAAGTAIGMAPMDLQGGPSGVAPVQSANPAPKPVEQPKTVEQKAEPGVGTKGHGYGGDPFTEPVRQYFRAQERITFQNADYAAKLYKAQTGNAPKDFAEYEREVLKPNNMKLPELPPGHTYVFKPNEGEHGELFVKKPRP